MSKKCASLINSVMSKVRGAWFIAGMSLLCACCITLCVILPRIVHPCKRGEVYDSALKRCRLQCPDGENQTYNAERRVCDCPSHLPVFDPATLKCVRFGDALGAGGASTSCEPPPSVDLVSGKVNNPTHFASLSPLL